MIRNLTRRTFLGSALGTFAAACTAARDAGTADAVSAANAKTSANVSGPTSRSLAELEARIGGRVGVFALDTSNGRELLTHRADERFAMCSTFKWTLAAAILARVDHGQLSLDERVPYTPAHLMPHSPVTTEHVAEGSMTLDALARAAVTVSDNAAANLLLPKVDGPAGLTRFVRSLGDSVTRLDRDEPDLNTNDAGDPRDTTSPRAMVTLMQRVLCGDALSATSREHLLGWLRACTTGKERIRAGLPESWAFGDKTGTGERGTVNDVGIAWPPGRAPILVASYLSDSQTPFRELVPAHAEIGRLLAKSI